MAKKSAWLSDKDYNFIFSQIPRLCVDIVIKNKDGVLLSWRDIQPAKNTWHLPGGRVYFRETLVNAVKRIAKQEVGLKVAPRKILGVIEYTKEVQNGHKRHTVGVVFQATPTGGNLKGSSQAKKIEFFKKLPPKTLQFHAKFLRKHNLL